MIMMKIAVLYLMYVTSVLSLDISERLNLAPHVRFSPEQKHRELLENVIEVGLNRSRYLVEVKEKELFEKGIILDKSQPGHFVSVFNKQQKKSQNVVKICICYTSGKQPAK